MNLQISDMTATLAIIADDLTGALDASAPFAARGLKVSVALSPRDLARALADRPQVVAVSTASREIPADLARRAVTEVMAALPPGVRIFKKVDSRLKGNIAAELDAIRFRRALAAPAIPDFGRIVDQGCVTGFGVETPIPVAAALGAHWAQTTIPDTDSIDSLARALAASDADLLIGARGLAEALAASLSDRAPRVQDRLPGPSALFVVGSRDPITLAQVAQVGAQGAMQILDAPNGDLPPALAPLADLRLVRATPGDTVLDGAEVAARLARAVHPALTQGAATLLLTGGATAEAVLARMGIVCLRLLGECLPGMAVARPLTTEGISDLTIIAKSGGFGDDLALVRLAEMVGGVTK